MSDSFNPYQKWLGIPPKDQPPNHYRLLGLETFESDADTISHAADRQMAHVRTFQHGQHAALSQKLLNELAGARKCLLDPQRKAQYDQKLRSVASRRPPAAAPPPRKASTSGIATAAALPSGTKSPSSAPPRKAAASPVEAVPGVVQPVRPTKPSGRTAASGAGRSTRSTGQRSLLLPLALAGGAVVVLGITLTVVILLLRSSAPEVPGAGPGGTTLAQGKSGSEPERSTTKVDLETPPKTVNDDPFVVESKTHDPLVVEPKSGDPFVVESKTDNDPNNTPPKDPREERRFPGPRQNDDPVVAQSMTTPAEVEVTPGLHVAQATPGATLVASAQLRELPDSYDLTFVDVPQELKGLAVGSLFHGMDHREIQVKAEKEGIVYLAVRDYYQKQADAWLRREGFHSTSIPANIKPRKFPKKHDYVVFRRDLKAGQTVTLELRGSNVLLISGAIRDKTTLDPASLAVLGVRPIGTVRSEYRVTSGGVELTWVSNDPALTGWRTVGADRKQPDQIHFQALEAGDVVLLLSPELERHSISYLLGEGYTKAPLNVVLTDRNARKHEFSAYRGHLDKNQTQFFNSLSPADFVLLAKSIRATDSIADATDDPSETERANGNEKPLAAERAETPDAAALAKSRKQVEEIFKLSEAKSAEQKQTLAKEMVSNGKQTAGDPAAQYVMFDEARRLAAEANDLYLAMDAIDQLEQRFEMDAMSMKLDLLGAAIRWRLGDAAKRELVGVALPLVDQAIQADKYVESTKLLSSLLSLTGSLRDEGLKIELSARRKLALQLQSEYRRAEAALRTLETSPDDAQASLAAGRFYCLVKNDWERGLPLLAKGSDEGLKTAAAADVARPSDAEGQLALADRWYDLAQKESGAIKGRLLSRSGYWYETVAPKLKSLDKLKVDQRLKAIADSPDVSNLGDRPAGSKTATIYAAADGRFELAVNGVVMMQGAGPRAVRRTLYLKSGDVIAVRATRVGYQNRGFSCVINYAATNTTRATGDGNTPWQRYTPSVNGPWYQSDPNQTTYSASTTTATYSLSDDAVAQAASVKCEPLYCTSSVAPNHFVLVVE